MQKIKDSFYVALRDRLAALNPSRTVVVSGASRPAVLVSENETYSSAPILPMVFYLSWGEAKLQQQGQAEPMISLECSIRYAAEGTQEFSYHDRGRLLEELSQELLSITSPQYAALMDHSQQPAMDLGARIFWSRPILGATEVSGDRVLRTGRLRVHASTEVAL